MKISFLVALVVLSACAGSTPTPSYAPSPSYEAPEVEVGLDPLVSEALDEADEYYAELAATEAAEEAAKKAAAEAAASAPADERTLSLLDFEDEPEGSFEKTISDLAHECGLMGGGGGIYCKVGQARDRTITATLITDSTDVVMNYEANDYFENTMVPMCQAGVDFERPVQLILVNLANKEQRTIQCVTSIPKEDRYLTNEELVTYEKLVRRNPQPESKGAIHYEELDTKITSILQGCVMEEKVRCFNVRSGPYYYFELGVQPSVSGQREAVQSYLERVIFPACDQLEKVGAPSSILFVDEDTDAEVWGTCSTLRR